MISEFTNFVRTWEFIPYLADDLGYPCEENESVTVNFIEKGISEKGERLRNAFDDVSVFDQLTCEQIDKICSRIKRYNRWKNI